MTDRYNVRLSPAAAKSLAKLHPKIRQRLRTAADVLADNPRPPAARQLVGSDGLFRVRVGDWRLIYRIEDAQLIVLVVRLGHRRDVYRRLT